MSTCERKYSPRWAWFVLTMISIYLVWIALHACALILIIQVMPDFRDLAVNLDVTAYLIVKTVFPLLCFFISIVLVFKRKWADKTVLCAALSAILPYVFFTLPLFIILGKPAHEISGKREIPAEQKIDQYFAGHAGTVVEPALRLVTAFLAALYAKGK